MFKATLIQCIALKSSEESMKMTSLNGDKKFKEVNN